MQPSPEEMMARIRATFNAASDHFDRLRAAMAERLDGASDGEVFSDVLYAVARKAEAQGV